MLVLDVIVRGRENTTPSRRRLTQDILSLYPDNDMP